MIIIRYILTFCRIELIRSEMELQLKILAAHFNDVVCTVPPQLLGTSIYRSEMGLCKFTSTCLLYRSFDPEIPSSASMSELRQELSDMKSEILELKQLMRTSFDLQMEIQRAIRQEVAAALSSACTPTSQPIAPTGRYTYTCRSCRSR